MHHIASSIAAESPPLVSSALSRLRRLAAASRAASCRRAGGATRVRGGGRGCLAALPSPGTCRRFEKRQTLAVHRDSSSRRSRRECDRRDGEGGKRKVQLLRASWACSRALSRPAARFPPPQSGV